jgi:hypothetical protein
MWQIRLSDLWSGSNISFWILIGSFVLLVYSLYIAFLREDEPAHLAAELQTGENTIIDSSIDTTISSNDDSFKALQAEDLTGNYIQIDKDIVVPLPDPSTNPANDTQVLIDAIIAMYDEINQGDYDQVVSYFDSYMQTTDTVRDYFRENPITQFASIMDGSITVSNIVVGEPAKKDRYPLTYTLSYVVNGQTFTEERNVLMRPQMGEWKIGTIACESNGCTRNPFFNIAAYR